MTKILIVDQDTINSSKLKLVLSKYGACQTAATGTLALEMIRKEHEAGVAFDFISLESQVGEVKADQLAQQIRALELELKAGLKAIVALMLDAETQQQSQELLDQHELKSLLKPYNRKSLEAFLLKMGLSKIPPPPPKKTKVSAKAASSNRASDARVKVFLKKMNSIFNNPDQLQDPEYHHIIEELIKNGGNQVALAMGQYFTNPNLPVKSRIDIIGIAGEIRNPLFLVPLNRVLDTEDNIKVGEAALNAIAKFGDQRALTLLGNALKKLQNSMLLNTIRREIAKIKENNPVLAILPRFLQSYKVKKTFRVTLDILKKIVTAEHSPMFVNYLKSGNDVIEDGTFELLCGVGDPAIKSTLFNFFEDRIPKVPCLAEKDCHELYTLVSHIQAYLLKNPQLLDEMISEFKELYGKICDIRARQILLAMLCSSQNPQALGFVKSVYTEEKELQEWIIEKLSGNRQAVDFLFEKYHAGQEVEAQVVKSLLKSEQGLQYFITHFFTFELDKQELIVKNLSFSSQSFLVDFVRKIYASNLYSLKCYLLHVLKDHYLFEFENTLFDPGHQREFSFMGNDYLDTIIQLYPITTLMSLYNKIAFEDISYTKIKKYLERIREIAAIEPVVIFRDSRFINNLFNKIVNANNVDLNTQFYYALENVKAMDLQTYKFLLDSTNTFLAVRGAQINQKEKAAIDKFKKNLQAQIADIRDIENVTKELNVIFANKPISQEALEKFLKIRHTAVAIRIDHVVKYLAERLPRLEYMSKDDNELFHVNFPTIGKFMDYYAQKDAVVKDGGLLEKFKDDFRLVLNFEDKRFSAILQDQFREVMPLMPVALNVASREIKRTDILLCDVPVLKELVVQKVISHQRIYLYLESRGDYAQFREFNPKAFMEPLSAHRVVKLVLKELYLDN